MGAEERNPAHGHRKSLAEPWGPRRPGDQFDIPVKTDSRHGTRRTALRSSP